MMSRGPESWHPDPYFFYQPGAGPMFDMGPYYLTTLIYMLGPIRRLTGSTRISFPERLITSKPQAGQTIPVRTATHIAGVIDFVAGPIATIITSFDVWGASLPRIEIYGSEGTLTVPDPNRFDGLVSLRRAGSLAWEEIPLTHSPEVGRGIGVAELAYALRIGRPHRANGDLAYHVLEALHAFEEASHAGRHMNMLSRPDRPAALPAGLAPEESLRA
jgi:predicted dehydrogenase